MNPGGWNGKVTASKVDGVRHFQNAGYRIFAFVDNEPDNLEAVAGIAPDGDILLSACRHDFQIETGKGPQGSHEWISL